MEAAEGRTGDGVHVKAKERPTTASKIIANEQRRNISQLSNEAAQAERNAAAARAIGDEATAAQLESVAKSKILEARKILKPYLRNGDLQGLLDRLDVSTSKNGAHFWSGWKDGALQRAAALAEQSGGISLETTPGGRVVNGWDAINKSNNSIGQKFWPGISEKYAAGAEGTVRIVQSDLAWIEGGGNIWKNIELPQIIKSNAVADIIFLDLEGNVRAVYSVQELKILNLKPKIAPGG